MDYEKMMAKATKTIETKIAPNEKFEVKSLFPDYEWERLSKGDRVSFGRYFSTAVNDGRFPSIVRFGEGKTHHNRYIKKEM